MKKIAIIIFFIIFSLKANSQASGDFISYKSFNIVGTVSPSPINLEFNSDKKTVTAEMGIPDKITRMEWETIAEDVDEYLYGANSIYIDVDDANVWGCAIRNSLLCINYNTKFFKVGDNISTLSLQFPTSYMWKGNGRINIGLLDDISGDPNDYYLYFDYDSNNLITEIGITSY